MGQGWHEDRVVLSRIGRAAKPVRHRRAYIRPSPTAALVGGDPHAGECSTIRSTGGARRFAQCSVASCRVQRGAGRARKAL